MGIFGMTDDEKKKISDQHKKLEKETREKKEQVKQGLTKPEVKKENKKTS
jgi:hypothetical protein